MQGPELGAVGQKLQNQKKTIKLEKGLFHSGNFAHPGYGNVYKCFWLSHLGVLLKSSGQKSGILQCTGQAPTMWHYPTPNASSKITKPVVPL